MSYYKSNQIAIAKLGLIVEEMEKYGISKYPVKIGTIDGIKRFITNVIILSIYIITPLINHCPYVYSPILREILLIKF